MIDTENQLLELADRIGQRMAVAITNSGQMLFLYHVTDGRITIRYIGWIPKSLGF